MSADKGRVPSVPDEAVVAVTERRLADGFCPHERPCGCRGRLRGSAWACLDALVREGWTVSPPARTPSRTVTAEPNA